MRLLVVGGSSLMAWVVRHVVPEAVEVEHVTTFPGVRAAFRRRPPQAVVFNLSASPFPWAEVYELCRRCRPPVPTLFHSYAYVDPSELGIPEETENFFNERLPACTLRREIERLIRSAESAPPASSLTPPRGKDGVGADSVEALSA